MYYTANFWKTQFTGSMSKGNSSAQCVPVFQCWCVRVFQCSSVPATVCARTICTTPLVKTPDIHVVETTCHVRNVLSSFYSVWIYSPPPFPTSPSSLIVLCLVYIHVINHKIFPLLSGLFVSFVVVCTVKWERPGTSYIHSHAYLKTVLMMSHCHSQGISDNMQKRLLIP